VKKSDGEVFKVKKPPFISSKVAADIKVESEKKHLIIDLIQVSGIYKEGGGTLSHYYVTILSFLSEIRFCDQILQRMNLIFIKSSF